jgi:hypothetical protein
VQEPDGRVRLKLDDVVTDDLAIWKTEFPYTSLIFDAAQFEASELSAEDLSQIGFGLVVRLAAVLKLSKMNAESDGKPDR